jgi:hypothetical protein
MTTCSKIDGLRARSMCVCDFAYLLMKIWPHCNLVLMYQWWLQSMCVILHIASWRYGHIVTLLWCINDDCNLSLCVCVCVCVCDFASHEICFCDYLCAVKFFVWFTYSLAKLVIISTVWQINLFLSRFLMQVRFGFGKWNYDDCWRWTLFLIGISF